MSNNAKDLLNALFNIIMSGFIINKSPNLLKTERMMNCFNDIRLEISATPGIYRIRPEEGDMEIIISSSETINDHTKQYLITIADTAETYKVERITYSLENARLDLLKDFNEGEE